MMIRWTNRTVTGVTAGLTVTAAAGLAVIFLIGLPGCSNQQSAAQGPPGKLHAKAAVTPLPSGEKGRGEGPVRVQVVRPTREHLKRLSTPQPAHVGAYEKTDLYARVPGYLDTFGQVPGADGAPRPVDIGDRVVKGQVLARLSVPELEQERLQKAALVEKAQTELGQAEASVKTAEEMVGAAKAKVAETFSLVAKYEADVVYRKVEWKRYLQLSNDRAVQKDVVDEKFNQLRVAEESRTAAKSAVATAEANVKVEQAKGLQAGADKKAAEARLKVAQEDLKLTEIMVAYATIKAPYDGIITRRLVDTGALIQSAAGKAEPLFTVARVDRLRIIAHIPEAEAGLVKVGQPAAFQVGDSRSQQLTGKVVRSADALDSEARTMRTEVELDAPAQTLRTGMFGKVTITFADVPDALLLPTSALLTDGGKPAVLCFEEGKASRREVELGLNDGGRVQVIRGLTGSEQVITSGKSAVREGQAVEVAK